MVFFHAIFLLIALGITFGLNWLAWIIPAHAAQELGQFVVPVIAVVSTFFIALTDDVGGGKRSPKPRYLKRAILIGLICFGAWYYFSHLRYTSEVISQLQEDYEDPKQELYAAYEEEFGVSGFWGYLLWSAKAGAHVSLSAEDSEPIEFDLPSGWVSFVVNWGYRVVNLYLVVWWVTKSYNYLKQEPKSRRSAASPARTTKPTTTSRPQQNAQAYLRSGEARRKQGNHDEAIAAYTEAIRLDPALIVAYNNRGLARREKGDKDGAIADYTEAIRLNPAFAVAYTNRGYMFQEKGNLDEAIADYTEAIRLDPTDKWPYNRRGYARLVQGDHEGAIADGTEAIRLDPTDAVAYTNRGVARWEKGDQDGAIADHTEAIRLDPGNAVAYTNRGIVRREKGDYDGAITDYTEAINLDPAYKWPYYRRAFARRAKRDQDGAIADYTEAIRLDPAFAQAYSERGDVRRVEGDLDGAIADTTEAIRLDPALAVAYTNRGVARHQQGDHEGADADFTEALRLNPDDVVARAMVRKAEKDSGGTIDNQTATISETAVQVRKDESITG